MTSTRFNDDVTARAYRDLLLPLIFNPWGRLLIEKAGLKSGDQVLDLATGPGTLARLAAKILGPESKVVGVDNSPQMMAQARAQAPVEKGAALEFLEAPAEKLPFPNAHFDAILCQQGIQFFSDQGLALREMKRVLRTGGKLALSLWSDDKAMTLFVALLEAVDETLTQASARPALKWFDSSRLEDALAGAGFRGCQVSEERLNVVLDGGLDQALELAMGTTAGAPLRAMNSAERSRFDKILAAKLKPWSRGATISAPARALVAVATA